MLTQKAFARFFYVLIVIFGGSQIAATSHAPRNLVVYGTDDRADTSQSPTESIIGHQTVAVVRKTSAYLCQNNAYMCFSFEPLHTRFSLCDGEKFADQPVVAMCSGTLVADDLVATAGHCLNNATECSDLLFVTGFDVAHAYNAVESIVKVPSNQVYDCAGVVYAINEAEMRQHKHSLWTTGWDYAVLRLTRSALSDAAGSRTPATVAVPTAKPSIGAKVFTVGHPSGLLRKYTRGQVLQTSTNRWSADFDTFGGTSGSGVFDNNGVMIGIHVIGMKDYLWYSNESADAPLETGASCLANEECPFGTYCWEGGTCDPCIECCRANNSLSPGGTCPSACGGRESTNVKANCRRAAICTSTDDIFHSWASRYSDPPTIEEMRTRCAGEWQMSMNAVAPFVHVLNASCDSDADCTLTAKQICTGPDCSCGPGCAFHCAPNGVCQFGPSPDHLLNAGRRSELDAFRMVFLSSMLYVLLRLH